MKSGGSRSYSFDGFTLDLLRGSLFRGEREIKLRPKSFEVLAYLAANSGRLLAKAELMQAIWPDSFVTDDSLVQCLIDVRRALGDDAQQLIKTVPRRGYIFNVEVKTNSDQVAGELFEEQLEGFKLVIEEESEPSETPATYRPLIAVAHPYRRIWIFSVLAVVIVIAVLGLLKWFGARGAGPSAGVRTIAVLPFKPIGTEQSDEYLGLGMADALITKLGSASHVIVRPTTTVRKYTQTDQDLSAAGRELRVDSVLSGSIQRSDNRMRITVQLVTVEDGRTLWTGKFDEKFTDIFTVEDSISEQVAQALTLRLTRDERRLLTKHYTENSEAYQAYLKGRYHWNKRSEEGFRKALDYFEQSIDKDPNFAQAYAGMADCYVLLSEWGVSSTAESASRGAEAVARALALDDTIAEAHASLALIKADLEWDFASAEKEFKRAIELNPNYAMAHSWYSCFLTARERFDEASTEMKRAEEVDPVTAIIGTNVGWALYMSHKPDLAREAYRRTVELDPNFSGAHRGLGWSYELERKYPEAIAEFQKALKLDESPYNLASVGHAYAGSGDRVEAEKVLLKLKDMSKQRFVTSYFTAAIEASLGKRNEAIELLEKSYRERVGLLAFLKVDPWFDDLHSEPRFQDLIRRIGL
jgi:TolB-like protein/DNA-binding winged helix-turn-helix (wHTH) protein/Tfp pilus assembly protein PilF